MSDGKWPSSCSSESGVGPHASQDHCFLGPSDPAADSVECRESPEDSTGVGESQHGKGLVDRFVKERGLFEDPSFRLSVYWAVPSGGVAPLPFRTLLHYQDDGTEPLSLTR